MDHFAFGVFTLYSLHMHGFLSHTCVAHRFTLLDLVYILHSNVDCMDINHQVT